MTPRSCRLPRRLTAAAVVALIATMLGAECEQPPELTLGLLRLDPIGSGQTSFAGRPLPNPVGVRVVEVEPGERGVTTVNFRVVSGGGTISPQSVPADNAETRWTLGPAEGEQVLEASMPLAARPPEPALITANAVLPRLSKFNGDKQVGDVGQTLPLALTVQMVDKDGKDITIAGEPVAVEWTAFDGLILDEDEKTDAAGRAKATYKLPQKAGTYLVGVELPDFAQTGFSKTEFEETATATAGPDLFVDPGSFVFNSSGDVVFVDFVIGNQGLAAAPSTTKRITLDPGTEQKQEQTFQTPELQPGATLNGSTSFSGVSSGQHTIRIELVAVEGETHTENNAAQASFTQQ